MLNGKTYIHEIYINGSNNAPTQIIGLSSNATVDVDKFVIGTLMFIVSLRYTKRFASAH